MAVIDRYDGNLEAFASTSLAGERTVFGAVGTSNTLDGNITADFLRGWGIVSATEVPSKQDFNALSFTTTLLLAYLHQMGVAEWNVAQEYRVGSAAIYLGEFYISKTAANIGNIPSTSTGNWKRLVTSEEVLPSGAVQYFAQVTAPSGWLECDGGEVAQAAYPDLYAAIGTTYDNSPAAGNFNLPDLRGQFLRGYDNGAGVDSGRAFGSKQNDGIIDHTHNVSYFTDIGAAGTRACLKPGSASPLNVTAGVSTPNNGGTETRPKNVAMLPCIKT